MCLGVPGQIVEISESPDVATVEIDGVIRTINLSLLRDSGPRPGDWVLIHLGFALEKLSPQELADIQSAFDLLGADDDAVVATGSSGAFPR
jgi:hydrogenase expression/formation protein HypC